MAIGDKHGVVMVSDRAVPNGIATLGSDGKLSEAQRPSLTDIGAIASSDKGKANGIATLGSDGKLSEAQRPATDSLPTKDSKNPVQSGGVYSELQKKSNKNLFDNWYFINPINQRGENTYSASGYGIDRWKQSGKITLEAAGIRLSSGITFQQPMEDTFKPTGKTITFSLLTTSGLIFGTGTYTGGALNLAEDDFVQVRVSAAGNPYISTKKEVIIIAAKLERGSVQTLAYQSGSSWILNDALPSPASELLECQRFFYREKNETSANLLLANGVPTGATTMTFSYRMPIKMRAMPNISTSSPGDILYTPSGFSSAVAATNVSRNGVIGNDNIGLMISGDFNIQRAYNIILAGGGYIDFNAEL